MASNVNISLSVEQAAYVLDALRSATDDADYSADGVCLQEIVAAIQTAITAASQDSDDADADAEDEADACNLSSDAGDDDDGQGADA